MKAARPCNQTCPVGAQKRSIPQSLIFKRYSLPYMCIRTACSARYVPTFSRGKRKTEEAPRECRFTCCNCRLSKAKDPRHVVVWRHELSLSLYQRWIYHAAQLKGYAGKTRTIAVRQECTRQRPCSRSLISRVLV